MKAFIVSLLFTASVGTFLRFPRKASFSAAKYESISVASATSHDDRPLEPSLFDTCAYDLQSLLPNPESVIQKFHIHGWRWHTLALLRDFSRLEKLATRLSLSPTVTTDSPDIISKAINHVVGFNWKGLHRIENQVFFPWLKKNLLLDGDHLKERSSRIRGSLEHVIQQMEECRVHIDEISKEMVHIHLNII